MSFFIGNIKITKRVILAPMAGITSFSYRKFMNKFGVGLTYSEMISDCGLIYGNEGTLELLKSDGSDRPLAIQLFGGSKETILKGLEILNSKDISYDILDLNLACPVPKVVKNNGGSSWLKDQSKLFEMVSAVCQKSIKPVSCKIRLGYNDVNVYETCKTLEKAGCKFIAIHCRTKKQLYSGLPVFSAIKDLKKIISIPFCVSGNIYTVNDALEALKITNADAVMVARGGIGNPNLIKNINKALNNEPYNENKNLNEQLDYLTEFSLSLINEFGEIKAIRMLRGIATKFLDGIPDMKKYKNKICQETKTKQDLLDIIEEIRENYIN